MRRLAGVSFALILVLSSIRPLSAFPRDYLTDDEQDIIRDAGTWREVGKELPDRVKAYFMLAQRRLVALGVKEQSEKEKNQQKKDEEARIKRQQREGTMPADRKAPDDPLAYLADFTPSELLRGYIQILDEVMTNIDDAYRRKLDVRDSIEDLAKFAHESLPLLEKFEPKSDSERAAKNDAVEKAKQTVTSAKNALNLVPKTEKKRKR